MDGARLYSSAFNCRLLSSLITLTSIAIFLKIKNIKNEGYPKSLGLRWAFIDGGLRLKPYERLQK
jgi:hypothetical protein